MRELVLALVLAGLMNGCGLFESPSESSVTVECDESKTGDTGVRCGDKNRGTLVPE